jgi:hypothetical protein
VVARKHAALIAALGSEEPHPQVANLNSRAAAFENV